MNHWGKYKAAALLFSLAVCCAAIIGCEGTGGSTAPQPVTNSSLQEPATQVPESQKLIVYTSHKEEVYRPIIQEFEEETGILVDTHAGGTTEMLHLMAESEADANVDVFFGGGVASLEAYREYLDPYSVSLKDSLDPSLTSTDDRWTPFTELPLIFIYNNKLVSEEDAPKSWREFLDDTWKGEISFADPEKSGTSFTILETLRDVSGLSLEETIAAFCDAMDGDMSEGSGEVLQLVDSGEKLVGITLEESALKEIARGNDISIVYPEEGTSVVPDGAAIVRNAPHRENAEKFLDFIVGDAVQNYAVNTLSRRSVRQDLFPASRYDFAIVPINIQKASAEETKALELFHDRMGVAKGEATP